MADLLYYAAEALPALAWFRLVNGTVGEPYLDEYFHVRQAQHYCAGHYGVWDPKITTPPGLYLISAFLSPVIGCGISALRGLNVYVLMMIGVLVMAVYEVRRKEKGGNDAAALHSALNVALFPPLFFFSGLYYTDVVSTLSVLVFYWGLLHFETTAAQKFGWLRTPVLVLLGAISLFFRQTNVFWVALFPAGLVLVNRVDQGHDVVRQSMHQRAEGFGDGWMSVVRTSWKMGVVYDLPVRDAWVEDYGKTIASLLAASLSTATQPKRLFDLLGALTPYITLLALFATFVAWNGGVVLGDKSNHVPTLHLPQLLYLSAATTFFSWPLLYPYLFTPLLYQLSLIPHLGTLQTNPIFKRRQVLPRLWVAGVAVMVAGLVVWGNTIVHPFTLADNRHYTFYIFRLLMRPWWVKYAVTPIYVLCGWAGIQALGARPAPGPSSTSTPDQREAKSDQSDPVPASTSQETSPLTLPDGTSPAKTTFTLILLATTALQLITAPLVEPRYFILPWIFWRLHVPLQPPLTDSTGVDNQEAGIRTWLAGLDHRLILETIWLAAVNVVTGYIFLNWTFEWPQEPGAQQRFMW